MKRLLVTGYAAAIAVLASWFAASYAAASHPDILRDYRFIPSRSSLDVSGGFIGIQETFHVFGTFGLVTGYDEGVVCLPTGCLPTHVPFAEFVDVPGTARFRQRVFVGPRRHAQLDPPRRHLP